MLTSSLSLKWKWSLVHVSLARNEYQLFSCSPLIIQFSIFFLFLHRMFLFSRFFGRQHFPLNFLVIIDGVFHIIVVECCLFFDIFLDTPVNLFFLTDKERKRLFIRTANERPAQRIEFMILILSDDHYGQAHD